MQHILKTNNAIIILNKLLLFYSLVWIPPSENDKYKTRTEILQWN